MNYDDWKSREPEAELELEACGHTIGTCDCRPPTCQHYQVKRVTYEGLSLVRCQHCPHKWREAPIYLEPDHYKMWLILLETYT